MSRVRPTYVPRTYYAAVVDVVAFSVQCSRTTEAAYMCIVGEGAAKIITRKLISEFPHLDSDRSSNQGRRPGAASFGGGRVRRSGDRWAQNEDRVEK